MEKVTIVTSRTEYETFVAEQAETVPLYYHPWWLDAVTGGAKEWQPWCALSDDGRVLAVFPLYTPVRGVALSPPYTQVGGIYFSPGGEGGEGSPQSQHGIFGQRRKITMAFVEAMPQFKYFEVPFPTSFTDWLPYYWQGYSSFVRYSYARRLPEDEKDLLASENRDIRHKISLAKQLGYQYQEASTPEDLLRLSCTLYRKKGLARHFLSTLEHTVDVAMSRGQGLLPTIYSKEGDLLAAGFTPYEGSTGYLIASASVGGKEHKAAPAYLIHSTMLALARCHLTHFDFEGSMLQGVEAVFRSFYGEQYPFYRISKGSLSLVQRLRLAYHYRQLHAHR